MNHRFEKIESDVILVYQNILQVKLWLTQLGRPIAGLGRSPLALRGAVTTMCNAADFCHDLEQLGIKTLRKRNIRYCVRKNC